MAAERAKKRKARDGKICIGMVINTAVKPSRDVMFGIVNCVRQYGQVRPKLFHGNAATLPRHIAAFAAEGVDGLVFCGMRKEIVVDFLRLMPTHPPLVLCSYLPFPEREFAALGRGGIVVLDNPGIGRLAADFFLGHGMRHFTFFGSKVHRESIAGEIRCTAFRDRLAEKLGAQMSFTSLIFGNGCPNEDYWDGSATDFVKFIAALPYPCGILANGDREAFGIVDTCNSLGIAVPDQVEIIGVNNSFDFCEAIQPSISSISPDHARCAQEAVKMVLEMIDDPHLPPERRQQVVSGHTLIERGSTLSGRGYGGVAVRAREYIRQNACRGITVSDVAGHLGVSRRTLEKRVSEAMGQSVAQMIRDIRLERVCHLLKTTALSISEVTFQSGYPLTSNLGMVFRKRYGMSMRQYRKSHRNAR